MADSGSVVPNISNTVNSKMTAIADKIRGLRGLTGTMGLDAMATNLEAEQTSITNALAALADKGVTVPDGSTSDALAGLIAGIEAGGGGFSVMFGSDEHALDFAEFTLNEAAHEVNVNQLLGVEFLDESSTNNPWGVFIFARSSGMSKNVSLAGYFRNTATTGSLYKFVAYVEPSSFSYRVLSGDADYDPVSGAFTTTTCPFKAGVRYFVVSFLPK